MISGKVTHNMILPLQRMRLLLPSIPHQQTQAGPFDARKTRDYPR